MTHTELLKEILIKADAVKAEYGNGTLTAAHIVVAVTDFCKTKYTGFCPSDMTFHPSRFEEERLRYVFEKTTRVASYFRLRLSQNTKAGVAETAFDMAQCQAIGAKRETQVLSADTVFLCALKQLPDDYRPAAKTVITDGDILACLEDTDKHIYDYVIEKTQAVRQELEQKAKEAAAIRDWKPAAKFTEPEELAALFFGKIEKTLTGNVLTLKFPKFFGATDLKVSVHRVDGVYYIHDNGCALRHLSKQVKDKQKLGRIVKKISHPCFIRKGRLTGSFRGATQFLLYLQDLVFVAQADLYYTRCSRLLRQKNHLGYVEADRAEPMDTQALLAALQQAIHFCYDENRGLYYWLEMSYSLSSARCVFLLETLDKGKLRISDKRKGAFEGEIFENFYFGNDDITPHSKFISKIARRFGGEFDGKDVYLTDKQENFFPAMGKFFNLAVVLSLFGRDIALPRRKR